MSLPRHSSSASLLERSGSAAPLQVPGGVFLAAGIEHGSAALPVRERIALTGERLKDAQRGLITHPAIAEVAILSTCNRTELYLFTTEPIAALDAAHAVLVGEDQALRGYVREWREMQVAQHLFRVSAGLESQILGERQILAQVRQTLERAERLITVGPHLHQLFRSSIACGRAVRAATKLGRVDASLAIEAIRAAEAAAGPLHGQAALVVGAGQVSRMMVAELRRRDIGRLYVSNRTQSVAEELAAQYGAVVLPMAEVGRCLPSMDIVVSATSAPWRILTMDDVHAEDLSTRPRPLHLFDLAVPRDIDPVIGTLPGIVLHDLDSVTPSRIRERYEEDVRGAMFIVRDHVRQFERWCRTRDVTPLIAELRRQMDEVAETELHRASQRLAGLSEGQRDAVESLTNRVTDAVFHRLVTRLRLAACTDDRSLVEAATFFFGSDAGRSREPVAIGGLAHATSCGGESR